MFANNPKKARAHQKRLVVSNCRGKVCKIERNNCEQK